MKNTDKLFALAQTDAILIIGDKNRLYFTGFQSTFGYLVLLKKNRNIFITDLRYYEMAHSLEDDGIEVQKIAGGASITSAVASIFKKHNVKTVGFEDTELTVREFEELRNGLKDYSLVPIGEHIGKVRSVKDDTEISYIKRAQAITDAAFLQVQNVIKAGMTERDLAVELEYLLAKNGAEGLAFDTIIASGLNSSKPHAHPTDKVIQNGDAVTMDFGARYHGYCSDMTRTIFVGEPSAEMRKIYNIVLMAQLNGIINAYPGISGKELDSFCREVIKANGYAEFFTHSTGHSLGIDIHEYPRASALTSDTLNPRQLITCEPGIYVPGVGGVRIEDLLLIEENGVIDLTTSDKNLIIL